MIVVLDGKESYQLNARKQALIRDSKADGENIIVMDASSRTAFSMEAALNQCSTISLFGDRRVILLSNPYFLKAGSGTEKKSSSKKNPKKSPSDLLDQYCRNPNPDTDLLFVCDGFLADKRTKEYKVFSSYAGKTVSLITFSNPSPRELETLIERELRTRGYHLSRDAMQELKLRIGDSATEFYRTLDKLDLYGKKEVSRAEIIGLVSFNPEVNVWKLSDSFIRGRRRETIECWKEMTEHADMDVFAIIPTLAYRLKKLFAVKRCYERGFSNDAIKARTGSTFPDRDLDACGSHSSLWFLERLADLAEIDQGIKTGKYSGTEPLEMFLLRNLQNGR